jgi:hypothetical protein
MFCFEFLKSIHSANIRLELGTGWPEITAFVKTSHLMIDAPYESDNLTGFWHFCASTRHDTVALSYRRAKHIQCRVPSVLCKTRRHHSSRLLANSALPLLT